MSDVTKIRLMKQGEEADVARFMADVYGKTGDSEATKVLLCSSSVPAQFSFVAIDDKEEIHGIVIWQTIEVEKETFLLSLAWLAVQPTFQRNGLAKRMIQETVQEVVNHSFLRHREMEYFIIEVEDDNEQALAFYRKFFPDANESLVGRFLYFVVKPEMLPNGEVV